MLFLRSVLQQNERRRDTLLPSLLPSLSDERRELLQKVFERKLPWTDMETQYYDAVSCFYAFLFTVDLSVFLIVILVFLFYINHLYCAAWGFKLYRFNARLCGTVCHRTYDKT